MLVFRLQVRGAPAPPAYSINRSGINSQSRDRIRERVPLIFLMSSLPFNHQFSSSIVLDNSPLPFTPVTDIYTWWSHRNR